jgi:membrane-associated phospholipid phosphatase
MHRRTPARISQIKKNNPKLIVYIFILLFICICKPTDLSCHEPTVKSLEHTIINSNTEPFNRTYISWNSGLYCLDYTRETFLLGGGAVMGIGGLVLINNVTPLTIAEIEQLDPNDINSFDRHSVGKYRDVRSGDALLYGSFLLPFTFLASERTRQDWKRLGVIGIEVLLIQAGLNAIIKAGIMRTRPYAYDPNTPIEKKTNKDARLSFYSGHTSTSAAISFYVAKVFSDYLSDMTIKTFIWSGAALYPALVGYLRQDSGHHFRTDVITGYAIGAMIGYLIPELHKACHKKQVTLNYLYSGEYGGIRLSYKF